MTNHTLSNYDRQLNSLTSSILEMGALVRELIVVSKKSLRERDPGLVEFSISTDKQINALERQIEEQVTVILALQNPMAVDLRFVTSALKISSALERAGDLAKNTTKRSVKLGNYTPAPTLEKIDRMVDIVVSMLDDALSAVETRDPKMALDVWKRDDGVDELYHEILTSMQQEMLADPNNILSCTHIVFGAKNFERIADYATNLAKTVHYVNSGAPIDKQVLKAMKEQ